MDCFDIILDILGKPPNTQVLCDHLKVSHQVIITWFVARKPAIANSAADAASRCLASPLPKEAPILTGNVKNARMNKGAGLDTAASTLLVHLSTMFDEPIQMLDCLQSNLEWMGEKRETLQFRPCHSSHYEPTITHMSESGCCAGGGNWNNKSWRRSRRNRTRRSRKPFWDALLKSWERSWDHQPKRCCGPFCWALTHHFLDVSRIGWTSFAIFVFVPFRKSWRHEDSHSIRYLQ